MTTRADPNRLGVWHAEAFGGELWRDGQNRIGFTCHADWLQNGFHVGRVLPMLQQPDQLIRTQLRIARN